MNNKYTLDTKNLLANNSNVQQVMCTKSVALSIIFALVGLGIIVLSSFIEDKSSATYMGANTLAIVLIIIGFYRLLFRRNQLVYKPTSTALVNGSFYFDTKHMERLKGVVVSNESADYTLFEFVKSGNARLDYMVSKDSKFLALQLFQYVPYTFEPACEVVCYEGSDAETFGKYILEKHNALK